MGRRLKKKKKTHIQKSAELRAILKDFQLWLLQVNNMKFNT